MVEATRNATTGSSGHTHGEYCETYQKEGETDNVGIHAVRTEVLHTSSTAHGRYTHSRLRGDETLTRGRERRERSSASTLQHQCGIFSFRFLCFNFVWTVLTPSVLPRRSRAPLALRSRLVTRSTGLGAVFCRKKAITRNLEAARMISGISRDLTRFEYSYDVSPMWRLRGCSRWEGLVRSLR